jgi:hypothetical protein
MSSHSHNHRRHRRRSLLGKFLDSLKGKNRRSSHHRSEFPGINLPKDYDPIAWKDKSRTDSVIFMEPEPQEKAKDFSQNTHPDNSEVSNEFVKPSSSKRKKSISDVFDLYFKKRELRREERIKKRIKRMHYRRSQEEYRKMNAGPGFGKKLLGLSGQDEEADKEKKLALFSQRNPFYRNLTIIINSALIFLITYSLVYLFYWLTCMMVASIYGLDSTLYFYDLKFNDHSALWNRFNILLVTGIPPFFCLFLGIFLYRVLFKIKRFAGLQKLFILWSSFHLFNHFFGAFPSGVITDEGFGYVAAWMYMNTAFKFMFSLVSLFGLGLIGYLSAKQILETSDSMHRIKSDKRVSFIFFQMAIPWLIGTIILLLVRIPHNFDYPYETLMLFTAIFLVIPPFFNEKVKPELNLLKVKKNRKVNVGYVAMMILLLAFLRIMLGIGLHFIIEINISISPAIT